MKAFRLARNSIAVHHGHGGQAYTGLPDEGVGSGEVVALQGEQEEPFPSVRVLRAQDTAGRRGTSGDKASHWINTTMQQSANMLQYLV